MNTKYFSIYILGHICDAATEVVAFLSQIELFNLLQKVKYFDLGHIERILFIYLFLFSARFLHTIIVK